MEIRCETCGKINGLIYRTDDIWWQCKNCDKKRYHSTLPCSVKREDVLLHLYPDKFQKSDYS